MTESFEKHIPWERLADILARISEIFHDNGIVDSEEIRIVSKSHKITFYVPQYVNNDVLRDLDRLAKDEQFLDFSFQPQRTEDGFTLEVTYQPGNQTPQPDWQKIVQATTAETTPERVRAVFTAFTEELTEQHIDWAIGEPVHTFQLRIAVLSSYFDYSHFTAILAHIDQANVNITYNNDDKTIDFSLRVD